MLHVTVHFAAAFQQVEFNKMPSRTQVVQPSDDSDARVEQIRASSEKFKAWLEEENRKEADKELVLLFEHILLKDDIDPAFLFGGKLEVIKLALKGEDEFTSSINSFWQNTGIVGALIGIEFYPIASIFFHFMFTAALGVSIVLGGVSTSDAFVGQTGLSEHSYKTLIQLYYALGAMAASTQLAVVVIVLVAYLHFTLMITPADKVWFICYWDTFINVIPQILVILGCVSVVACVCVGSFIVGDIHTGIIVTCIASLFVLLFLYIWITMLNRNFERAESTVLKLRKKYKELLPANNDENRYK
jgi:hypothetical protein